MEPVPVTILRVQGEARAIVREGEIMLEGGGVTVEPMLLWYSIEGPMLRVGTGEDGACEGDQVVPDSVPCRIPLQGVISDLEAVDSGELQVENSEAALNARGLTCTVVGSGAITFTAAGDFPSVLECALSGGGRIRFEKEVTTQMFECRLENTARFEGGPLVVGRLIEVHAKNRSVVKGVKSATPKTRVNIDAEHSAHVKVSKLPRSREEVSGARVSLNAFGAASTFVSSIGSTGDGNTVTVGRRGGESGIFISSIGSIGSGNTVTIGGQAPLVGNVICHDNAMAVHINTRTQSAQRKRKSSKATPSKKRTTQAVRVIPSQVSNMIINHF